MPMRLPLPMVVAAALAAAAAPAWGETVTIEIGNVRNAAGIIHVDLCRQDTFLSDHCLYSADTPAHVGITAVTIRNVAPGRYAAQAYHDENSNNKVDRALFGIPREGVGFSRDARIRFGPPSFADAVIEVAGHTPPVRFALRYFIGPSGPPRVR